jgi:hypothetical protein
MEPRTPLRNLVTQQGLVPGTCAIVLLHLVTIGAPYKTYAGNGDMAYGSLAHELQVWSWLPIQAKD